MPSTWCMQVNHSNTLLRKVGSFTKARTLVSLTPFSALCRTAKSETFFVDSAKEQFAHTAGSQLPANPAIRVQWCALSIYRNNRASLSCGHPFEKSALRSNWLPSLMASALVCQLSILDGISPGAELLQNLKKAMVAASTSAS